jgi:hypothetical protein
MPVQGFSQLSMHPVADEHEPASWTQLPASMTHAPCPELQAFPQPSRQLLPQVLGPPRQQPGPVEQALLQVSTQNVWLQKPASGVQVPASSSPQDPPTQGFPQLSMQLLPQLRATQQAPEKQTSPQLSVQVLWLHDPGLGTQALASGAQAPPVHALPQPSLQLLPQVPGTQQFGPVVQRSPQLLRQLTWLHPAVGTQPASVPESGGTQEPPVQGFPQLSRQLLPHVSDTQHTGPVKQMLLQLSEQVS